MGPAANTCLPVSSGVMHLDAVLCDDTLARSGLSGPHAFSRLLQCNMSSDCTLQRCWLLAALLIAQRIQLYLGCAVKQTYCRHQHL